MRTVAPKPQTMLLGALTFLNVCLQLASALLLKIAPEPTKANVITLTLILGVVLALNAARFLTWGALHRRFPISLAYPLSALFFPAVVALAWITGERVGVAQLAGAALVMAGVARILVSSNADGGRDALLDG